MFDNNPIPQGAIDRYRIVKDYSVDYSATIGHSWQFNNTLDRDGLKVHSINTEGF